jgi:hypothetical protein
MKRNERSGLQDGRDAHAESARKRNRTQGKRISGQRREAPQRPELLEAR